MLDKDLGEKGLRILSMYDRLQKGEVLVKSKEAEHFGVSSRTIQRDINTIRFYTESSTDIASTSGIEFDQIQKGYRMVRARRSWLLEDEVLAITKVLLESRGFAKEELVPIVEKIILHCNPDDRKYVHEMIRNELHHYTPVSHNVFLTKKLWELNQAVREKRVTELTYRKEGTTDPVARLVQPVGIIFSEFYFYLLAYMKEYKFDFPTIYRIDRIQSYSVLDEHFHVPYSRRFEEGEFRKRVQFMQSGELMKIQFKFWGESLEAVCDRLPTARVISREDNYAVVEAEVFGAGIKMWLLSQAEYLEVISPASFRDDMKKTIQNLVELYSS